MEEKKHFKLYKSGKLWCCAAVIAAALTIGTTITSGTAHADTVSESVQTAVVNNNRSRTVTEQETSDINSAHSQQSNNQVPVDTVTKNNDVNANQGSLDHYQVSTNPKNTQTTLQANGWQAVGKSNTERYRWTILYDNTNHQEIGRQAVQPVSRPDVHTAVPNVVNSGLSGFNVQFKLPNSVAGHSLSLIARYSTDALNGEGQHTDYWFNPIILNNDNRASLDNLSSDQKGQLHVSGWHATNQAWGKQYHYIIAYDQTLNREIARQETKLGQRNDVAQAYPTITSADVSGFDVTFKLSPQYAHDNIQFISRWTDDPAGNGNAVDYWFGPVNKQNRGNLDSWDISNGYLKVNGWHADDASIYEPYHYLILFDNTTGQQVVSKKVTNQSSNDVAKVYGDTRSANNSRFSSLFDQVNLEAGHTYSLVSRYSTTNVGNGDDGNGANHTDYWFNLGTLNGSAYNIDGWHNDGKQLTINGWFASDQSLTHQYPYVVLLADGREVARQEVKLTDRNDVAAAYPHLANSLKSDFTVTFATPNNAQNSLQLVLRYTNTNNGEGDHQDIWTPNYSVNAGNFDHVTVNGNTIHVDGWHATMNSNDRPYQYIIAVDSYGNEINRWNITGDNQSSQPRSDVQKAYPWITNSGNSGFAVTANGIDPNRYAYFTLIHRYTDDVNGNGNYIDFTQNIDRTNYNERLTNAWRSIINGRPGHIGIAVKSQLTGKVYSYSNAPGYHWMTMSTVKVAVLSELLHRTGGNLDGTMQNLATQMIQHSDNTATTNITNWYLGGAQGLQPLYRQLGMWNTGTNSTWGSSWTTPEDQIKLLNDLYLDQNSGYLNQQSRDYIHYQMSHVSYGQDWGISAGTPRGSFYIKNGWMPFGYQWVNSIGFIPSSDNHHGYAIAVYTDGDGSFQAGINVIEQLARATKQIMQG